MPLQDLHGHVKLTARRMKREGAQQAGDRIGYSGRAGDRPGI